MSYSSATSPHSLNAETNELECQGRSSGFAKCFFSPASRALPPTLLLLPTLWLRYDVTRVTPLRLLLRQTTFVRFCSRLVMFDHTVVNQQPPSARWGMDGGLLGGSRTTLFHWVPLYQLTMLVNSNSLCLLSISPLLPLTIHIHLLKTPVVHTCR
jgi:hypothetical protein